jgi:hypothetical protein
LWYQLWVIHEFFKNRVVPLVYALLPDKNKKTYVCAITFLLEALAEIDENHLPDIVISDFEKSEINALEKTLKCRVQGCFFHFSQCVVRKVLFT